MSQKWDKCLSHGVSIGERFHRKARFGFCSACPRVKTHRGHQMFNSNVAPRRRLRELKTWFCHTCNQEVKRYLSRCPDCQRSRT